MSVIRPFRGVRYNLREAGELSELIAPPYDIITPEMKAELHRRSPYNIIRLILGEDLPTDDQRNNRYTRAAALWQEWLDRGILLRDPEPAIYRYNLEFTLKTAQGMVNMERPGFVALLKLFEYDEGKVLPHERTLAGPKQDRFQLMSHVRAHLSQVFMLYHDPKGELDSLLGREPPPSREAWAAEDDIGVLHKMWRVTEPEAVKAAQELLEQSPVYIADGHHRYETALAYRRHVQNTMPLFARAADYVMAYFTPAEHSGLVIFPYHRVLHNLPKRRLSGLLNKLKKFFQLERVMANPLTPGANRRNFIRELEERGKQATVFGMVSRDQREAYFLQLKPEACLKKEARTEVELELSRLDVVVLEELVLMEILGLDHKDLLNEKHVVYETDYDRALDLVQEPPHQLAFLLNPTPVESVLRIAELRGIMPEKSTYFYPKIATGLVMNQMDEP